MEDLKFMLKSQILHQKNQETRHRNKKNLFLTYYFKFFIAKFQSVEIPIERWESHPVSVIKKLRLDSKLIWISLTIKPFRTSFRRPSPLQDVILSWKSPILFFNNSSILGQFFWFFHPCSRIYKKNILQISPN